MPSTITQVVAARIPNEHVASIAAIADRDDSTISATLARLIAEHLDRRIPMDEDPTRPAGAWQNASNAKRLAALDREDTRADLCRHLREQYRAGEITREEYFTRCVEVARMVFNRADPEITDEDATAAHQAFLEIELTARGVR